MGPPWFLGPCPLPPPTLTLLSLAPPPAQAKPKGAGLLYQGGEGLSSLPSLLWTFSLGRWLSEGGLPQGHTEGGASLDFAVGMASLRVRAIFVGVGST